MNNLFAPNTLSFALIGALAIAGGGSLSAEITPQTLASIGAPAKSNW